MQLYGQTEKANFLTIKAICKTTSIIIKTLSIHRRPLITKKGRQRILGINVHLYTTSKRTEQESPRFWSRFKNLWNMSYCDFLTQLLISLIYVRKNIFDNPKNEVAKMKDSLSLPTHYLVHCLLSYHLLVSQPFWWSQHNHHLSSYKGLMHGHGYRCPVSHFPC